MNDGPDIEAIARHILTSFPDVGVDETTIDTFFFCDPGRKFPFATIVTHDSEFDPYSKLDREGVFRLSVNIGKDAYVERFGEPRPKRDGFDDRFDYAALDSLAPHPVYGRMYWVSILNPSNETFEGLKPLIAKAHEDDVRRFA